MKWYVFKLCLMLASLGLSGCLRISSSDGSSSRNGSAAPGGGPEFSSNGPRGNGEGFLGAVASVRNAQARCGFQPSAEHADQMEVVCRVAIVDEVGNEKEATAVEEGTTLAWAEPVQLKGPQVSSLSCQTANGSLAQICEVTLGVSETGLSELTQLEFALQASSANITPPPSKTTVSLVSAQSYGVVPHLPSFQALASSQSNPEGRKLGLQQEDFDPLTTVFGSVVSMCTRGPKLFFATASHVFVLENGRARLYAGSSNRGNFTNFTSRLTVALGTDNHFPPVIGCMPNGIAYTEYNMAKGTRMLILPDDGPVTDLLTTVPKKLVGTFTSGPDNQLYVAPIRMQPGAKFYQLAKLASPTATPTLLTTTQGADAAGNPSTLVVRFPYAYLRVRQLWRVDLRDGTTIEILPAPTGVSAGDGGPVQDATFANYRSFTVDANQNLYLAEATTSYKVRRIDAVTKIVTTIFGGEVGTPDQCGPAAWSLRRNQDCGISSVTADDNGTIYLGTGGSRIWSVSAAGVIGQIVASSAAPSAPTATSLRQAAFNSVSTVALVGDSALVAENYGSIKRLRFSDDRVETIPGIAIDRLREIRSFPNGDALISAMYRLYILKPDGKLIPYAGYGPSQDRSLADGTMVKNFFGYVYDIAIHPNGTIYVKDNGSAQIFAIDPTTQTVKRIAGTGAKGFSGDGGPALNAQFQPNGGIDVGSDNALYFADSMNGRIRRIDLATGIITTIAGSGGQGAMKEGAWADEVSFHSPTSVRVTSQGDIYVAATGDFAVRVLHPIPQAGGGVRYNVTTLLGDTAKADKCTGRISHKVNRSPSSGEAEEIKTSLDTFCQAIPISLDVKDRCAEPNGDVRIAVNQSFSGASDEIHASSIAMITRPCN